MTEREPYNSKESFVVFYQLSTKFVDNEREIPDETAEVMYYSLAIGHHTGVIDCFSEKFRCPLSVYLEVIELLPEDSKARYKLEGILRHGEIQVDKNHAAFLLDEIREPLLALETSREAQDFSLALTESLHTIQSSPVVYLMGRLVEA
ncbi:MAG: formate hydrogenlyase maturation protein HycH [Coriobacteriia bacterium]|nr:formate hydrogenlyase maturation protein HycH [Coriobacteriia bacterium]MCL2750122.1 formate hydrogenlyase maturation protein HycH [Coriobacteriia bacterium]